MTIWEWVAVGASAIAVPTLLLSFAIAKILAEIGRCASQLTEEQWASAPLTRARRRPTVRRTGLG
jgi:hypothetical protein